MNRQIHGVCKCCRERTTWPAKGPWDLGEQRTPAEAGLPTGHSRAPEPQISNTCNWLQRLQCSVWSQFLFQISNDRMKDFQKWPQRNQNCAEGAL